MRVLLDTQVFLWWINDSPELSTRARRLLRDTGNALFLSLASTSDRIFARHGVTRL